MCAKRQTELKTQTEKENDFSNVTFQNVSSKLFKWRTKTQTTISWQSKNLRNRRERETGQRRKNRGRWKWCELKTWEMTADRVSYDKSHPLNPQREYCPVLSYRLPVPCSGPTDTRWPSVNQQIDGRELWTSRSDRCSLSAPSSHWHTVIMVYSFTLKPHKTLKGKEEPSGWPWINRYSTYCTVILAWFNKMAVTYVGTMKEIPPDVTGNT